MSLKKETIKGTFWSSIEKFSLLGIQFILQIVLARLLTPADYGIIGILAVFIAISNAFIDSGFTSALIQKKDRTKTDFSTAFYFNLIISLACYIILYFCAPYIANFYQLPILTSVTRALAIALIFMALSAVNRTILQIKLDFKTQAKASLSSVILSGIIGIYLAYKGFGVWALVLQQVSNSFFNMLLLFALVRWKPLFVFSLISFKSMFSYGVKILISHLLDNIYFHIRPLIIGKLFSMSILGLYSRAHQFSSLPTNLSNTIFGRVAFPLFSKVQDDFEQLFNVYCRFLKIVNGMYIPLILLLCAVSKQVIIIVLGYKWIDSVILLRILSLAFVFDTFSSINAKLLLAKGYSNVTLQLNFIKKIIALTILIISIPFGIIAICWGSVVYGIIAGFLGMFFVKKIFKIGLKIQLWDIIPIFLVSGISALLAYITTLQFTNVYVQFIFALLIFLITYTFFAYKLQFDIWKEIISFYNQTKIWNILSKKFFNNLYRRSKK